MPLVLSYAGCGTCKKALAWLRSQDVDLTLRAIVEEPPTRAELARWIPASGLPVRKWLNTSGQSYRAIGKEQIAAATEATIIEWLAKDGKLVKRPVLVDGNTVLVGFNETAWAAHFAQRR